MTAYIISGTVITGLTKNIISLWPVMPNNITKINDNAFLNCDKIYGELRIPDSVVEIGNKAFEGCSNLYWIRFNDDGDFESKSKLRMIGNRAFYGTSINDKGVYYNDNVQFYSEKYLNTNSRFLEAAISLEYIGYQAFAGINNSKFFTSNSFRRKTPAILNPYVYTASLLDYDAFGTQKDGDLFEIKYKSGFKFAGLGRSILALYHSGNKFIQNQQIDEKAILLIPPKNMPDSVVELISSYNTNNITPSDNLGLLLCNNLGIDKLTYLPRNYGVNPLKTKIETDGAYWRNDLLPDGNYRYNSNYYQESFPDMQFVPKSRTTIGKNAVMNFPFTLAFNNIVWEFPTDYVGTNIPPFTFYRALGLETINIPLNITTIGAGAFRGCKNLNNISFDIDNSKLRTIEESAFKSCPKLREIRFPKSLETYELRQTLLVSDKINVSFNYPLQVIGGSGSDGLVNMSLQNNVYTISNVVSGTGYVVNDICSVNFPTFETLSVKVTEINSSGAIVKLEFLDNISSQLKIKLYFFPNTLLKYNEIDANLTTMNTNRLAANYPLLDVRVYTFPVYNSTNTNVTSSNSGVSPKKYLLNDTLTFKNTVTAIDNDAFKDANLLNGSLQLPTSLVTIGSSSFKNCSSLYGQLTIPSNVTTIGESAFENCSGFNQEELTIPPNVFNIDSKAFRGMTQLKVVRVPNGTGYNYAADAFPPGVTIINTFSDGKFEYINSNKTLIRALVDKKGVFPTIPSSVTGIDSMAFINNSVSGSVILNKELEDISSYAFEGCNRITSLIIPPNSSLKYIGLRSFYQSSIGGNIDLSKCPNLTNIWDESFSFSRITGLNIGSSSSLLTIGDGAFSNCTTLAGQIKIPSNVTSIGAGAFYNTRITTLSFLQPKITIINKDTFSSCYSLTSFQLSSGVFISDTITKVDDRAFKDCNKLAGSLIFGLSITTIGISAFENCSKLTGVLIIPSTVTSIGSRAFAGCTGFSKIILPGGNTVVAADAFDGILKQKIQETMNFKISGTVITGINPAIGVFPTIPSNITRIEENAFLNCTGLRGTVTIPKTLVSIGDGAFKGCTGITKLDLQTEIGTIRSSLINIGSESFSGCINITGDVLIPKSVRLLLPNTFYNCTKALFRYYSNFTETSGNAFPPGRSTDLRAMIINSDEVVDNSSNEVVNSNPPPIVKLTKVTKPLVNVKRLNFANGQFLFNVKK